MATSSRPTARSSNILKRNTNRLNAHVFMAFVYDECVFICFYAQHVRKLILGIVFSYNIFGGIQDWLKALSE